MGQTEYPIIFSYSDVIAGNGYVVGVAVEGGRFLMVDEGDGDFWIYGVNPGGISDGGKSQKEATSAFRKTYQAVLYDIANEAPDFEAFKAEANDFLLQENEVVLNEWRAAVDRVRKGEVDLDWDRQPAESNLDVTIARLVLEEEAAEGRPDLQRPTATLNAPDHGSLAA